MSLREVYQNPEFLRLEEEIGKHHKIVEQLLLEMKTRFPLGDDRSWGVSKNGNGRYSVRAFWLEVIH